MTDTQKLTKLIGAAAALVGYCSSTSLLQSSIASCLAETGEKNSALILLDNWAVGLTANCLRLQEAIDEIIQSQEPE